MGCYAHLTVFCVVSGLGLLCIWAAWTTPAWVRSKRDADDVLTTTYTHELGLINQRSCYDECKTFKRGAAAGGNAADNAEAAWKSLYDWEKAVLALCIMSWLCILIAWVWGLAYACCRCCKFLMVTFVLSLLAFLMTLVAVIVYGVMFDDKKIIEVTGSATTTEVPKYMPGHGYKLFYSYYLAVVADIFFLASTIFAHFSVKSGSGVRPLY